jgi:hypothetical protein
MGRESRRKKPRRVPIVPPPLPTQSTSHGGVPLTADDLKCLAAFAGLSIITNDIEHHVRQIHDALHAWVLWHRVGSRRLMRVEAREWSDALRQWIGDGMTILGAMPDNILGWNERKHSATMLISRAFPNIYSDTPESERQIIFDIWHRLVVNLIKTGAIDDWPRDPRIIQESENEKPLLRDLESTTALVDRLVSGLAAIRLVLPNLDQYIAGLPTHPGPDGDRVFLIGRLRDSYEALHGRRFTISNPINDDPIPRGLALDWTRGLCRLVADRADAMPAEMIDKHCEFRQLAEWADKPHTLAGIIRKLPSPSAGKSKDTSGVV